MNIYLISSILYDDGILDHFIEHYLSQGINKFLFGIYIDSDIDINKYHNKYKNITFINNYNTIKEYTGKYDSEFRNRIKYLYLNNNDWYTIADVDEFIKPKNNKLKNIISIANNKNNNIVCGNLIDRVCSDGTIPEEIENNIWKQFDTNIDLTRNIFNNSNHKVVAAKSIIDIGPGHHYPISCSPWENKEYNFYLENNYSIYEEYMDIFHFKWKKNVLNISKNIFSNKNEETYLIPIIQYLDSHKNRIF